MERQTAPSTTWIGAVWRSTGPLVEREIRSKLSEAGEGTAQRPFNARDVGFFEASEECLLAPHAGFARTERGSRWKRARSERSAPSFQSAHL